jgi:hypothetical protein
MERRVGEIVTRFPDWPTRLAAYLASEEGMAFDWAERNCALFAAGGVEAMTGEDFGRAYRGPRTRTGVCRRLAHLAGDLEGAATAALGDPRRDVRLAGRGDLVLAAVPRPALGLVGLDGITAVFRAHEGLIRAPLDACLKAWRV